MRRINRAEIAEARENLALGGCWVEPELRLDGRPVGAGEPGPALRALDLACREDFGNPALTDEVPYSTN